MTPFIYLGIHYLAYKCAAALAATISSGRVTGLIDGIGGAPYGLVLGYDGRLRAASSGGPGLVDFTGGGMMELIRKLDSRRHLRGDAGGRGRQHHAARYGEEAWKAYRRARAASGGDPAAHWGWTISRFSLALAENRFKWEEMRPRREAR